MNAPTPYEARVAELEDEGLTTSDAQGVADVEFAQRAALTMLAALRRVVLALDDLTDGQLDPATASDREAIAAHEAARAALARAEGRV